MYPAIAGGIRFSEIRRDKKERAIKRGNLAGERFDYLYDHSTKCEEEGCKECARWERVCSELLKVWEL